MKYSSIESEYLVYLLRCAVNGKKSEKVYEGVDWKKLVDLANQQQVYSMIAPIIDASLMPESFANELMLYTQNELVRMLAMKSELDEISRKLNEKGIEYMLVKGSVLKKYYPQQKMRQMSDVDILYKAERQDELISYMKKKGYRLKTSEANSDDFFKPPFYTFEFHRSIFDERDAFSPDFNLWERATKDENKTSEYHISTEDLIIYSLCHMYDHYCQSGCGIRFVCDIYVLLKSKEDFDWSYINSKLEEFGFADFCNTAITLAKALFKNESAGKSEQALLDYILSGGVYGKSRSLDEVISSDFNGSKFKYFMSRAFPSKKIMKGNFPVLRKYPFLLPIYYAVRVFQVVKYNKRSVQKEIKSLKKH